MRTIKSSTEIEALFKRGVRFSSPHLLALVTRRADADSAGRAAFIAGRSLGGAVVRNRAKRILRHGCLRAGGPWTGQDVVLVARSRLLSARADEVDAEMDRLAEFLVRR